MIKKIIAVVGGGFAVAIVVTIAVGAGIISNKTYSDTEYKNTLEKQTKITSRNKNANSVELLLQGLAAYLNKSLSVKYWTGTETPVTTSFVVTEDSKSMFFSQLKANSSYKFQLLLGEKVLKDVTVDTTVAVSSLNLVSLDSFVEVSFKLKESLLNKSYSVQYKNAEDYEGQWLTSPSVKLTKENTTKSGDLYQKSFLVNDLTANTKYAFQLFTTDETTGEKLLLTPVEYVLTTNNTTPVASATDVSTSNAKLTISNLGYLKTLKISNNKIKVELFSLETEGKTSKFTKEYSLSEIEGSSLVLTVPSLNPATNYQLDVLTNYESSGQTFVKKGESLSFTTLNLPSLVSGSGTSTKTEATFKLAFTPGDTTVTKDTFQAVLMLKPDTEASVNYKSEAAKIGTISEFTDTPEAEAVAPATTPTPAKREATVTFSDLTATSKYVVQLFKASDIERQFPLLATAIEVETAPEPLAEIKNVADVTAATAKVTLSGLGDLIGKKIKLTAHPNHTASSSSHEGDVTKDSDLITEENKNNLEVTLEGLASFTTYSLSAVSVTPAEGETAESVGTDQLISPLQILTKIGDHGVSLAFYKNVDKEKDTHVLANLKGLEAGATYVIETKKKESAAATPDWASGTHKQEVTVSTDNYSNNKLVAEVDRRTGDDATELNADYFIRVYKKPAADSTETITTLLSSPNARITYRTLSLTYGTETEGTKSELYAKDFLTSNPLTVIPDQDEQGHTFAVTLASGEDTSFTNDFHGKFYAKVKFASEASTASSDIGFEAWVEVGGFKKVTEANKAPGISTIQLKNLTALKSDYTNFKKRITSGLLPQEQWKILQEEMNITSSNSWTPDLMKATSLNLEFNDDLAEVTITNLYVSLTWQKGTFANKKAVDVASQLLLKQVVEYLPFDAAPTSVTFANTASDGTVYKANGATIENIVLHAMEDKKILYFLRFVQKWTEDNTNTELVNSFKNTLKEAIKLYATTASNNQVKGAWFGSNVLPAGETTNTYSNTNMTADKLAKLNRFVFTTAWSNKDDATAAITALILKYGQGSKEGRPE